MGSIDISGIQEITEGLISFDRLVANLRDGSSVILKGRNRSVAIGKDLLVKVNVSIGCSDKRSFDVELEKLRLISELGYRPDAMMDLSIVRPDKPLYAFMIEEFGGPVGTLPHYLCYIPEKGIDPQLLLEEIERQAEAGVAWMTFHLTPRRDLYEEAQKTRLIATVARGGGIIIHDMYINSRSESVLSLYFNKILYILKKHDVTLSVGTTFRPANVVDALDAVHRKETEIQGEYIREARRQGIQVIMEGVGHMTLDKIGEYVKFVKSKYGIPFVPLGPTTTDAAMGQDHISNAIGAAYMAFIGGADMLNSMTREEHTGGVPSINSIVEGLKAAKIAAHSVNIARFKSLESVVDDNRRISERRAKNYTCVVEGGLFTESAQMRFSMGCTRCGKECPLRINYMLDKRRQLIPRYKSHPDQ